MKKILVVDDHLLVLRFTADLLSKEGHQVLTASDGLSALDILKAETPDIMFVDLIMPNISGDKLCHIVRRMPRLKDLYIIVLSGVAAERRANLSELGANACIAKGPFDKMGEQILAVLNRLDLEGPGIVKEETQCVGFEDMHSRRPTKELLAIKRHFEVILGSMSEGILEVTPDARIVYVNPSSISLIGIAEEKLLGSRFIELFSRVDRPRIDDLLAVATSGASETTENDTPVTLNGRHVLLNVLPVDDEDHESMVIILDDVTERKRLEEQRKRMELLEFANNLALKLMDELRNPLVAVGGFASRISSGDCPEDKVKEYTGLIFEESKRLDNTLEQVVVHLKTAAEQI